MSSARLPRCNEAGLRAEDPPEEWLVKAWDGDTLVDLIFIRRACRSMTP